jgi:uncharacterized protein YndB with AHSA1/START domain
MLCGLVRSTRAPAPARAGTGTRAVTRVSAVNDAVTVHVEAPPERVWQLVSDVTRIGSYSPETFEAEWLDGATGPEVGARFRGHVRRNGRGPTYWTTCEVSECEPGRTFAFRVLIGDRPANTWGYRLEPTSSGGTDATEFFELAPTLMNRVYWALLGWARGRTNRKGMHTTLERIKAEVEGG